MWFDKVKEFFKTKSAGSDTILDIGRLFKADFRLSDEQVEAFQKKHGKAGAKILSAMGSTYSPFYNAIQTDIGQELLKDSLIRMEALLEKIIDEKATDKDIADYRATKRMVHLWSKKIEIYIKTMHQIETGE